MKYILLSVLLSFTYTNVLLKLAGIIKCSWFLVWMPVWLPVLLIVVIVLLLIWAVKDIEKNKDYEYDTFN